MKTLDHIKDPIHLIEVAIRDTAALQARAVTDPFVTFDVEVWHSVTEAGCAMCMAGAVMAGELAIEDDVNIVPMQLEDGPTACKLRLINEIRVANTPEIESAMELLGWDEDWTSTIEYVFDRMSEESLEDLKYGDLSAWEEFRDALVDEARNLNLSYESETNDGQ